MVAQHYRWDFIGLSTDQKPTPATSEKVVDGSTFYCSDNSKLYVYCKDQWYEKTATGGGGTTYTAGDGIDITEGEISVDPTYVATMTELDARINKGAGAPTTATEGVVGGLYEDTTNGKLYICTEIGSSSETLLGVTSVYPTSAVVEVNEQAFTQYMINTGLVTLTSNEVMIQGTNEDGWSWEIQDEVDGYDETPTTAELEQNGVSIINYGDKNVLEIMLLGHTVQTPTYTWEEVGGGGVTPVQTTGTSTTDVMSQDATTKLIYPDIANSHKITIGASVSASSNQSNAVSINANVGSNCNSSVAIGGASNNKANIGSFGNAYAGVAIGHANVFQGSYGVAIGDNATSYYSGSGESGNVAIGSHAQASDGGNTKSSVALGYYSLTNRTGEVNVGGLYGNGYNGTDYRVIGGVHDGQNNHDCATVAQGNTLSTSAPDTSTVGVLGQLWTDTTNMHTYQCTAISGDTYTWTQRW